MTVVGIDVGGKKKGFHGCALTGRRILAGPDELGGVAATVRWVKEQAPTTVAIDSPCEAAPEDATVRPDEEDFNKAGICRIRWTPPRKRIKGAYYGWVSHGFELWEALSEELGRDRLIEVFPTAAWTRWEQRRGKRSRAAWSRVVLESIELDGLPSRRLNQDDRDAVAAALVARQYEEGKTESFRKLIVPAGALP
jgi:predicted nuclease with RNAse H fold